MLAKLDANRYIPTDKDEAFQQLWQIAENHRRAINDMTELLTATATTGQIIDMIKPLAREAFTYKLPVTFDDDGNVLSARFAAINHGELTGLGDDDHTQYLLANGARALTGDWGVGAFDIKLTSGQYVGMDDAKGRLVFTDAAADTIGVAAADLILDTARYIGIGAAKVRAIFTDDTTDYVTISDGRLGIATTGIPDTALHVVGTITAEQAIIVKNMGSEFQGFITYHSDGNITGELPIGSIVFESKDSLGFNQGFCTLEAGVIDWTSGAEDGYYKIYRTIAGTPQVSISGTATGITLGEAVACNSTLNVTGTTTLAAALNGVLIATAGVVSVVAASDAFVMRNGTTPLTASWDIGDTFYLAADTIRARDAAGLQLYDDGGNGITVADGGLVGIGPVAPTQLLCLSAAAASPVVLMDCYATTDSMSVQFALSKSASNTAGELAETADGEYLGDILWRGVRATSPAFVTASRIISKQVGAAGASYVAGRLEFHTATNAAAPASKMILWNTGYLTVGALATTPDSLLHVWAATAGTIAAVAGTLLTLENNDTNYLSFLTPNNKDSGIIFGDADDNDVGSIKYNHSGNLLSIVIDTSTELTLDTSYLTLGGSIKLSATNYVGLGDALPRFDFNGNASVGNMTIRDANVVLTTDKYVGIGDSGGRFLFEDADADWIACKNAFLGVGNFTVAPDCLLHVWNATAGAIAAEAGTLVAIENNNDAYLSFLVPNNKWSGILFGDVDDADVGSITYQHSTYNEMVITCGAIPTATFNAVGLTIGDQQYGATDAVLEVNATDAANKNCIHLVQVDTASHWVQFEGPTSAGAAHPLVDEGDQTGQTLEGWLRIYITDTNVSPQITSGVYYIPVYSLTFA